MSQEMAAELGSKDALERVTLPLPRYSSVTACPLQCSNGEQFLPTYFLRLFECLRAVGLTVISLDQNSPIASVLF